MLIGSLQVALLEISSCLDESVILQQTSKSLTSIMSPPYRVAGTSHRSAAGRPICLVLWLKGLKLCLKTSRRSMVYSITKQYGVLDQITL